jgi:uncharacterized protein (TIGR03435 family)
MTPLRRRVYCAIISLHPASFRNQFGRDMARDFDDALEQRGFAPLFGDAVLSLARQWKASAFNGPELDPALAQPIPGHPFLSGEYLAADCGRLTLFDWTSASVLSILLLLTIGFAASVPNRHVIADTQSARVSHDGGIDTGHSGPPLAANDSRRERPGVDPILAAPGLGVGRRHGPAYLVRSTAPPGFGPRAVGGPPARPITLVHALVQLIIISTIIWITSFFLRQSPGIGRRIVLGALGLLGLAASVAFGQPPTLPINAQIPHATDPLPSFEVATIKPRDSKVMMMPPGSRDIVRTMGTARVLVAHAYNVTSATAQRVLGGPNWIDDNDKAVYVVEGKIPEDLYAELQKMTADERSKQTSLMLQSLLADRFKLKVHFETHELPVYELVLAKGGSKLKENSNPAAGNAVIHNKGQLHELQGKAVPVKVLIGMLMNPAEVGGRMVVDKTGLTGVYDVVFDWQPVQSSQGAGADAVMPASPDAIGPPLFEALEEQLGLKLVPAKDPVEIIVIDSIEKPSEN